MCLWSLVFDKNFSGHRQHAKTLSFVFAQLSVAGSPAHLNVFIVPSLVSYKCAAAPSRIADSQLAALQSV